MLDGTSTGGPSTWMWPLSSRLATIFLQAEHEYIVSSNQPAMHGRQARQTQMRQQMRPVILVLGGTRLASVDGRIGRNRYVHLHRRALPPRRRQGPLVTPRTVDVLGALARQHLDGCDQRDGGGVHVHGVHLFLIPLLRVRCW